MSLFDDDTALAPPPPELKLPPIQGTERQYGWASSVRKRKLLAIQAFLAVGQAYADRIRLTNYDKAEEAQHGVDEHTARFEELCAESGASYWLARRDNSVEELLDDADPKPGQTYTWRNNERVEK